MQLLKNPGYNQLGPLALMSSPMAKLGRTHWVFDIEVIANAQAAAALALRTVSVTFCLFFKICVEWPKLRGDKTKIDAAQKLREQLSSIDFSGAWKDLPECIQEHIAKIGRRSCARGALLPSLPKGVAAGRGT